MNDHARIVCDPAILAGKPALAGTRLSVEMILEELASGATREEMLEEHPTLTAEGIAAALRFAADVLRSEVVYPVPTK